MYRSIRAFSYTVPDFETTGTTGVEPETAQHQRAVLIVANRLTRAEEHAGLGMRVVYRELKSVSASKSKSSPSRTCLSEHTSRALRLTRVTLRRCRRLTVCLGLIVNGIFDFGHTNIYIGLAQGSGLLSGAQLSCL